MCEPAPGPMCATHARRDLDRARARYRTAIARHSRAAVAATAATGEWERIKAAAQEAGIPVDGQTATSEGDWTARVDQQTLANIVLSGAEDDMHAAHARLDESRQTLTEARRSLAAAQRSYDVTPAGIAALEAAVSVTASRGDKARALAQVTWAKEKAEAIQQAWKRSSVYTEQRIARSRSEKNLSGLKADLIDRRCAEHGIVAPPKDPRAITAWQASPDGALLARVTEIVGPSADLTFMLPQVRDAATTEAVETAHWAHVPTQWMPMTTTAWLARARAEGRAWAPPVEMLVDAVLATGEVRAARKDAFTGGRRGDVWRVAPVTGPLRLPGVPQAVREGWVAARERDREVRALSALDRFQAPA